MKILVTGVSGQLGHDMVKELTVRGIETVGTDSASMNITDQEAVRRVITEAAPDAVIHCAAWTKVDDAEDHEEECRLVNAKGTEYIAGLCAERGIPMMYFSTDYVFDGEGERPWKPEDATAPMSIYGKTKLEGEEAVRRLLPDRHFILRLQWVYGINGRNFVKTMLKLSEDHDRLTVVNDQIGGPTYTPDIARLAADMIQSDRYGTYHVANEGYCSWYAFAKKIFEKSGIEIEVVPVSSEEFRAKARRPHNSRLNTAKLTENGFRLLPPWEDALDRYLTELKKEKA